MTSSPDPSFPPHLNLALELDRPHPRVGLVPGLTSRQLWMITHARAGDIPYVPSQDKSAVAAFAGVSVSDLHRYEAACSSVRQLARATGFARRDVEQSLLALPR